MAQVSRPWEAGLGDGIGAGAGGCYTADEWDDIFWAVFSGRDNDYGIIRMATYLHLEVFPTAPASSQVNVGTGSAIVNGKYYENTSTVTFPAAGFPVVSGVGRERYDRVVLEADWATRTVRIARVAGVEAATGFGVVPALTQNEGVLFQLPLATIYVDEFGIVAIAAADITDDREFIESRTHEFDAIVGGRPGDYALLSDALADGHLSVFIRAGTYVEAADVTLTSGMWICGESPENTIVNLGVNRIYVNEAAADFADRVIVENLQLASTHATGALQFNRARDCRVRNCYFTGSTVGVRTTGSTSRTIVENCHFDGCNFSISFRGTEQRAVNCDVENDLGVGVQLAAGNNHHISGCRVYNSVSSGMNVVGASFCVVSQCSILDNGATGIDVQTAVATRIVDNHIEGNTGDGISVAANAPDTVINDNVIFDNGDDGIVTQAVTSDRPVIVGNKIYQNAGNGMEIGDTHSVIGDNHVYDNTGHGISYLASGDYGVCKGNMCLGNGGDGIDIATGCDQVIVTSNLTRDNTGWGIDYAGDREIVGGNIALNNTAGQIDATGATNDSTFGNIVA